MQTYSSLVFKLKFFTYVSTHLTFLVLNSSANGQQAYFLGLGDLPGGEFRSRATDVSANGTVIVGSSRIGNGAESEAAFRWTRAAGMQSLGSFNGASGASAISGHGSTIVGYNNTGGFRWTQSEGITPLAALDGHTYMFPSDITSDGTASYGRSSVDGNRVGVRWINSGIEKLSLSPGLTRFSISAVSGDGSFLAGFDDRTEKGFVWSQSAGLQYITHPQRPFRPTKVSADGSTVVGVAGGSSYRWTTQTGLVRLENMSNGQIPGYATGVSADGSIIVGRQYEGSESQPWIWDQLHGTRYLDQVLISDYGLGSSLAGWYLDGDTFGISDDGRTIVGRGNGPRGLEAFVAYLGSPVPEPSSLLLIALAFVPFSLRRRVRISKLPRDVKGRLASLAIVPLIAVLIPANAKAKPAYFMGLGTLPGSNVSSHASDVSGDGTVVVGYWNYGANGLFRWTRETGMVTVVPQISLDSNEWSKPQISGDGSTIVGLDPNGTYFRWRESTGTVPLTSGSNPDWISGISGDGSLIALSGRVWTESGGLSPSPYGGAIRDVSSDGLTFVGYQGPLAPANNSGFTWSAIKGVTPLGPTPPDGTIFYNPRSISGDGKVVVGHGSSPTGSYNGWFRWTEQSGMQSLKTPEGGNFAGSTKHAISSDGSVIVGGDLLEAWIWRQGNVNGTEWLSDVLTAEFGLGAAIAGWNLGGATAISNDGRTIVGYGLNPSLQTEAWIAYLGSPVPEPNTVLLAALALVPFSLRRRVRACCHRQES